MPPHRLLLAVAVSTRKRGRRHASNLCRASLGEPAVIFEASGLGNSLSLDAVRAEVSRHTDPGWSPYKRESSRGNPQRRMFRSENERKSDAAEHEHHQLSFYEAVPGMVARSKTHYVASAYRQW
jgi:hypothetical protein